jgi:succinate-acetate transporter protein
VSAVITGEPAGTQTQVMADPTPIAFGLFAFALVLYGVRFVGVSAATIQGPTSEALNYAILVGGAAELLGGVLALIRGMGYPAWVSSVFGLWLIGFFLLLTHVDQAAAHDSGIVAAGPGDKPLPGSVTAALQSANVTAWHADSVAWYVFILIIPVVILAVPAFIQRNIPFMVAFLAVVVVLVLLGLGFHDVYQSVTDVTRGKALAPSLGTAVNLLRVSAYAAFVAAAALFWVFAREVYPSSSAARPH